MTTGSEVPPPRAPTPGELDESILRPTEMIRIQSQLESLATELRSIGPMPDAQSRARLSSIERVLRDELDDLMAPAVRGELHRLFDWLAADDLTSDELRLGLRALLGWVEGTLASLQFVMVRANIAGTAPGQ